MIKAVSDRVAVESPGNMISGTYPGLGNIKGQRLMNNDLQEEESTTKDRKEFRKYSTSWVDRFTD